MGKEIDVNVPDIGGATNVEVIEILVKSGDTIEIDSPLITLESDKASMEIPATTKGTIAKVCVEVGSKVSEGDRILVLQEENEETPHSPPEQKQEQEQEKTDSSRLRNALSRSLYLI